ncbi:putative HVA22-like protein g isoform X2 [Aristolochia californica]|uniref:putative HVA22-like protein g isoform X2 n=1 Tax=Aristolochia californica TaxID=171875 RepID=UPI0035E361DA
MLGDFITRCLILLFGYIYPAFECFKTVEKNRADIEQLRFWCQYWIIVAALTVLERFGDILVSWAPMYGEMKLAFFIYLWHPKTKGTNYVYEVFLRPYVARHETDIDRKLSEMRARAWDMAILYWQSFANQGQAKFFEVLRYLAAQSYRPSPETAQESGHCTKEKAFDVTLQSTSLN